MTQASSRNRTQSGANSNARSNSGGPNIPKSALAGAPGANQTTAMNRTTRRALARAQQALATGDNRQAQQILATITGAAAGSGGSNNGSSGGSNRTQQQNRGQQNQNQQQNQNRQQNRQQNQGQARTQAAAPVGQQVINQLFRQMRGSDATRAETLSFHVLLTALRDEDLSTLTAPDIFNLCRQSAITGLTFLTLTRPVTGLQQAASQQAQAQRTQNQQNQQGQQTRNQTQQTQNQGGSRRNRKRTRNRSGSAVTV